LRRVIPEDSDWLESFVATGRVDGLIVIGQSDQAETLDRVAAHYKPLVVWGGYCEGQVHCTVGSDNRRGGELAASHLLAQGCRTIAFFGDPQVLEIGQRLDGVRSAMAAAGVEDGLSILPAHLVAERAYAEISGFLAECSERPQGIVAASDVIAMSALSALSELGLSVPGDVRVVGYDGLAMGEQTVPRLTTVSQDLASGAAHLVDMLLRRIAGEDTPNVVMEPKLLVRVSG
jgi:DNA-binding LacI/PurR family transcriptional regulator